MFREYYIIQCKSTGDFICLPVLFNSDIGRATLFTSIEDATDTAVDMLENDFRVFSFYRKEALKPTTVGGVADSLEFDAPPQ